MKQIFILLIILIAADSAKSQANKKIIKTNLEFNAFLLRNIHYPSNLGLKCSMPATLVQIHLSQRSSIDSISFSGSTPEEAKAELLRVIDLTKGSDFYTNFKGKTLIIPVYFYLINDDGKLGCNYRDVLESQMDVLYGNKFFDNKIYTYLPPLVVKAYFSAKKQL